MKSEIGILYEHQEWFKPLFAELDKLNVNYDELLAHQHTFDPAERNSPYKLVVNRMSPSAYLRGNSNGIFHVIQYLSYLEDIGVEVINGQHAYAIEISKAKQLSLFENLGMLYPKARVINHANQVLKAAQGLEYPIIVKPNIGGSGALIQKFDDADELKYAAEKETIDLGLDHTALVQEYLPLKDGHIVRVEMLDDKLLYAIKIFPNPDSGFNLCPADICQLDTSKAEEEVIAGYLSNQEKTRVKKKTKVKIEVVETSELSDAVKKSVLAIAKEANLDLGGIEYLVNDRDGKVYYYDINALSNFVSDAEDIVSFNPYTRLAEYIARRAGFIQ